MQLRVTGIRVTVTGVTVTVTVTIYALKFSNVNPDAEFIMILLYPKVHHQETSPPGGKKTEHALKVSGINPDA